MENREIECIKARNIVHHFHNEIISRENYLFDTGKNVGYIFDIQIRFLSYMSPTSISVFYLTLPLVPSVPSVTCARGAEGKYQNSPALNHVRGKIQGAGSCCIFP
jgi:hypothetical protein